VVCGVCVAKACSVTAEEVKGMCIFSGMFSGPKGPVACSAARCHVWCSGHCTKLPLWHNRYGYVRIQNGRREGRNA